MARRRGHRCVAVSPGAPAPQRAGTMGVFHRYRVVDHRLMRGLEWLATHLGHVRGTKHLQLARGPISDRSTTARSHE
jgi:hypothetical protein